MDDDASNGKNQLTCNEASEMHNEKEIQALETRVQNMEEMHGLMK